MRPKTDPLTGLVCPSIAISSIDPLELEMPERGDARVVCPECGHWQPVIRGLVKAHDAMHLRPRANGKRPRCPGSAQHLIFDLTPTQWRRAHRKALAEAGRSRRTAAVADSRRLLDPSFRRPTRVHTLVYPPIAPAVAYMGRPRPRSESQLTGWRFTALPDIAYPDGNRA